MPGAFGQAAAFLTPKDHDRDPAKWVEERLNGGLWSKQVEIMESVRDNRRTAVRSCHSAGKSHTAALVACWWIDSHEIGEAFVVTTAPSFPQVRAILWRYMNRMHRQGKLPGVMHQTEWQLGGELVAFGRKPSDYDESAFQGIHAPKVLVILDEACGIDEQLYVAADTLTTTPDCRILAIGNPDIPGGAFERAHENWTSIKIAAFDTPNFTGEDCPVSIKSQLIDPAWVEEKRKEWGEDSPLWSAKILAEFPKDAKDACVRGSDVARCRIPRDPPYSMSELSPVELGVDVGGGGDPTVIYERRGPLAGRVWRKQTDRPEEIAPLVIEAIEKTGATACKIDAIGVGAGLLGELRNRADAKGCRMVGVKASNRPSKNQFANVRAEYWWMARELSEQQGWDLSNVDDDTVAQMLNPRWMLNNAGKIQIEKKDDIRDRLGRSPDDAEALILAYFMPGDDLDEWFAVRNPGHHFRPQYGQGPLVVSEVLSPLDLPSSRT
jgi:hypothetical protein